MFASKSLFTLILLVFSLEAFSQQVNARYFISIGTSIGRSNEHTEPIMTQHLVTPSLLLGLNRRSSPDSKIQKVVGAEITQFRVLREEKRFQGLGVGTTTWYAQFVLRAYLLNMHTRLEFPLHNKKARVLLGGGVYVPLAIHAKGDFYSGNTKEYRNTWMPRNTLPLMPHVNVGFAWNNKIGVSSVQLSWMNYPLLKDSPVSTKGNIVMLTYCFDLPICQLNSQLLNSK